MANGVVRSHPTCRPQATTTSLWELTYIHTLKEAKKPLRGPIKAITVFGFESPSAVETPGQPGTAV